MDELDHYEQQLPTALDDRGLARLAAKQYGHVTRAQLTALGMGPGAIARRQRLGRLVIVHRGVYSLGYPRPEPIARAAAAVLAGGPAALLSHESAAALWGLRKRWPEPPEITVTTDRRRAGIRTHSSRTLTARDVRTHLGIRVTSAARTLLDIAPRLTDDELARAFNDGRLARRVYPAELDELLARFPSHPGAARLRPLTTTAPPTRSRWETDFVAFAREQGLPEPQLNAQVAGYEVDALFADQRVIVELDSWEFHQDRRTFERDRRRDVDTLAAGYVTVRITWERRTNDAEGEGRRLRIILEARAGELG